MFEIIRPTKPRKPIKLFRYTAGLIWRIHTITICALEIKTPPGESTYVTDFGLKMIADAMRDGVRCIEQKMEEHAAERRAENEARQARDHR